MHEKSDRPVPARNDRATAIPKADVVSFGMVVPATLVIVDEFPQINTGATATQVTEFISDDAALVATTLRGWDVRSGLISTTLGNDPTGRRTVRRLQEIGVVGDLRTSSKLSTPYELDISDRAGNRTYFWQRTPEVLATLEKADLSLLEGARLLYVDWYDQDYILRPMREAAQKSIPVFLNFEHGHQDSELLARYAPYATICQAVTDAAQTKDNAVEVGRNLLDGGVSLALVTMAKGGCLALSKERMVRIYAPEVEVVDACAAGATFSAGFIYGYLKGWGLEEKGRFAVAAASLKCTVVGPCAFPIDQINRLAAQLRVEQA
ncbi:MAG: carbohydrate kinase family protein [Dehalococcoidia bacterium]|nr:carbohydrate kinase family protein [Dehalococcoidia bacterium]